MEDHPLQRNKRDPLPAGNHRYNLVDAESALERRRIGRWNRCLRLEPKEERTGVLFTRLERDGLRDLRPSLDSASLCNTELYRVAHRRVSNYLYHG